MPQGLLDGRYRLVERIGAGGMGEVWRAHDGHLHREVAVKLLTGLAAHRDPALAARFQREARAAARLTSPHIVTVYELGTARQDTGEEVPYLVMELVRGRSLAHVLSEGPPPPADTVRWADQMCRALGTAHTAGVVHRDMKPGNVLVADGDGAASEDRPVKVLDFGIARVLEGPGATTLTVTGQIVGTPAYMSPEQARGDVPVDARTDLYALGCILYELVTGRPPFEAATWHALLLRHIEEPPVPPGRRRPGLLPAWDELILDLLAKDPDARPASAAEVRARLAGLGGPAAGGATPTAPVPTVVDGNGPGRPTPEGPAADARSLPAPARPAPSPVATMTDHGLAEPAPASPAPLPSAAAPLAVGSVALVLCWLLAPWWAALPLGVGLGFFSYFLNARANSYEGKHR